MNGKSNAVLHGRDLFQIFPLQKGLVNLTSADGAIENVSMVRCVSAGTITITWADTTTDDIVMLDGDDYGVLGATSVEISSGTFHFA